MKQKINGLIDEYIKEDNREKLFDLAFEYENKIDLMKIANYYIEIRDDFYICELISVVSEYLNLDYIFDNIILTNDKEFMFMILNNGTIKWGIDIKYIIRLEKICF